MSRMQASQNISLWTGGEYVGVPGECLELVLRSDYVLVSVGARVYLFFNHINVLAAIKSQTVLDGKHYLSLIATIPNLYPGPASRLMVRIEDPNSLSLDINAGHFVHAGHASQTQDSVPLKHAFEPRNSIMDSSVARPISDSTSSMAAHDSPYPSSETIASSCKFRTSVIPISTTSTLWFRCSPLRQANAQYLQARLNFIGDLDSMCHDWTSQERNVMRRLVEIERSQSRNTITASFRPVTAEDRSNSNLCISCIWWARNKKHYCTSVDTVALLQWLVAVQFTVEEKNRIRRNLEGFKPLTISKHKEESDDAFRLIMALGDPKPRTIEKDIKVFPWPEVKVALKKIIGKYCWRDNLEPIASNGV